MRQLYEKCDTKGALCEDHNDTYIKVLKILGMSANDVYMVRPTHSIKYNMLEPLEQACIHCAVANMRKDAKF